MNTSFAPPQVVEGPELLLFGLSERHNRQTALAKIPSQWDRFNPYLYGLPGKGNHVTYGVVYNGDSKGNFDYLCGVPVQRFPTEPPDYAKLTIPPRTYSVFSTSEHISTIRALWDHALAETAALQLDAPAFEVYRESFDGKTGMGGFEIWIPIKSAA